MFGQFFQPDGEGPQPEYSLRYGAACGDLVSIDKALRNGAHIDAADRDGKTALHRAVTANQVEAVRHLLSKNANVNCVSFRGFTPLHIAADMDQNGPILDLLIGARADVDARDYMNFTPLHCAVRRDEKTVRRLLEADADPNDGIPASPIPLVHAMYHEAPLDVITTLLEFNSTVNEVDTFGVSALHYAACYYPSVLPQVLAGIPGVNQLDQNGNTALICAASTGTSESIQPLVNAKALLDHCNLQGKSALYCAVDELHMETMQLLLECKATPTSKILTLALSRPNTPANIALLLDHKAPVNCDETPENSPLLKAIRYNSLEVIHLLLERRACTNVVDHSGLTPLIAALRPEPHLPLIKKLLSFGADPEMPVSVAPVVAYNEIVRTFPSFLQTANDRGLYEEVNDIGTSL